MFGKLAEAQQKAEEIKKRLDAITVEGIAGNGSVKITVTGNKSVKQVKIADELMVPARKEELEELLIVAIDRAMEQADHVSQSEMKALMGNMMPGLGSLFGK